MLVKIIGNSQGGGIKIRIDKNWQLQIGLVEFFTLPFLNKTKIKAVVDKNFRANNVLGVKVLKKCECWEMFVCAK